MSPRKEAPPTFTQRHAEKISRLKLVLIVVCLVAIPVSFFLNHQENRANHTEINKIQQLVETPCLRFGSRSHQCEASFEAAIAAINHREACYVGQKMGIHPRSCEGTHLRAAALPREPSSIAAAGHPSSKEVMPSTPNKGHSPPGPSKGGPTDTPSQPQAPSVPSQSSGGGEATAPAAAPSAPTAATERITEVVHEAGPPSGPPAETAAAPVREAVGNTVEGVGTTATEAVHGLGCTVTGLLGTSCE